MPTGSPEGTLVNPGSVVLAGSVTVQPDSSVLVGPGAASIGSQSIVNGLAPTTILLSPDAAVVNGLTSINASGLRVITGYSTVVPSTTITDGGLRIQCSTIANPSNYQIKFNVSFLEQPGAGEVISGATTLQLKANTASSANTNIPGIPSPANSPL